MLPLAFVSHTGQDDTTWATGQLARGIAEKLIGHNVPVFFDVRSLQSGVLWESAIEFNAAAAQVFVTIVSPTYCRRYWCMRELDIALHVSVVRSLRKRVIIPIYVGLTRDQLEADMKNAAFDADWESTCCTHPDRTPFVCRERWYANLRKLAKYQATDAAGWPDKRSGIEGAVADRITQIIPRV